MKKYAVVRRGDMCMVLCFHCDGAGCAACAGSGTRVGALHTVMHPFYINWYSLRFLRFWRMKLRGDLKGTNSQGKWWPDYE